MLIFLLLIFIPMQVLLLSTWSPGMRMYLSFLILGKTMERYSTVLVCGSWISVQNLLFWVFHIVCCSFLCSIFLNVQEEHRARDLFFALWVPDLFMERVQRNGVWSLFCPSEAPGLADCWGKEFEELYTRYEKEVCFRRLLVFVILACWNLLIYCQSWAKVMIKAVFIDPGEGKESCSSTESMVWGSEGPDWDWNSLHAI